MTRPFPFTAVVGHEEARLALLLAAIDPAIGGVLLRGAKGSAKSTLARGLAGLLPSDAPFIELPIGATEDRVLGSIDVQSLFAGAANAAEGSARFRPGLLAAADGGVLYVDEVNLLPDQLVDALLDAAASGVNRVERDGVSHEHRARFVLLGSMNPEEGELRPQLLDRFGLAVEIRSPEDPGLRAEAVRRRLAHDAGQPLPGAGDEASDDDLAGRLATVRPAHLPDAVLRFAAGLAVAVGAESLRADLVLCRAAAALAGWEGRSQATQEDAERVAPLALGHRRRRRPFEPPSLPPDELETALQAARQHEQPDHPPPPPPDTGTDHPEAGGVQGTAPPDAEWRDLAGGALDAVPAPLELLDDRPRSVSPATPASGGRIVGDDVPQPGDDPRGLAVVGTVRAAMQRRADDPLGPALQPDDLRQPRRQPRQDRTVVLAVDASGSMGTVERVTAATGAVLGLLADAYLSRDQVALVAFAGDAATELLPPTASVELARARLADVPTGGPTPLAEGIATAVTTARRARDAGSAPLVVLLTDGRATGTPDALERARQSARALADAGIDALVLDAEDGRRGEPLRLAGELADLMEARCLHLSSVTAPEVETAVRGALDIGIPDKRG